MSKIQFLLTLPMALLSACTCKYVGHLSNMYQDAFSLYLLVLVSAHQTEMAWMEIMSTLVMVEALARYR